MAKRVAIFGAVIAIIVSAIIINLSILDLISIQDLKETLGKTLSIVAVSVIAILLIIAIARGREKEKAN
jgi:hypothetical protein